MTDFNDIFTCDSSNNIKTLVLGNNVTSIRDSTFLGFPDNAFGNNSQLKSLSLPGSLVHIGNPAFLSCEIESLSLDNVFVLSKLNSFFPYGCRTGVIKMLCLVMAFLLLKTRRLLVILSYNQLVFPILSLQLVPKHLTIALICFKLTFQAQYLHRK